MGRGATISNIHDNIHTRVFAMVVSGCVFSYIKPGQVSKYLFHKCMIKRYTILKGLYYIF